MHCKIVTIPFLKEQLSKDKTPAGQSVHTCTIYSAKEQMHGLQLLGIYSKVYQLHMYMRRILLHELSIVKQKVCFLY